MLLRPYQNDFVNNAVKALKKKGRTLGIAPTGCHAKGTPILMFNGHLKNVEDIEVGDKLMGPDSTSRTVQSLCRGIDSMYEIRPIKGDSFIVNSGHILSLEKTNEGIKGDNIYSLPAGTILNISVKDYLTKSARFKHLYKLYRTAVNFKCNDYLPIDPYFLGILIGDGGLSVGTPNITTPEPELAFYCQEQADSLGLRLRIEQIPDNQANTYFFASPKGIYKNILTEKLKTLGLKGKKSSQKFIPHCYKISSVENRLLLLAGLLDTDGSLSNNTFEYSTASKTLANDVAFIARSLGFSALPKPKKVNGNVYYRFNICGDLSVIPLKVGRKIPEKRKQKKSVLRTGFSVHLLDKDNFYGFTINKDNLYVMGDFTVTHNSGKTILLSKIISEIYKQNQNKDFRACVLAHRDELTYQNEDKFKKVNPEISTSICNADSKDWRGQVTFAMVQTLSRSNNLDNSPRIDMLVIDEAHHATSKTYQYVIKKFKERNNDLILLGVTATPIRNDDGLLKDVFGNVCHIIKLKELIASGYLVPPRTFVIDLGIQKEIEEAKDKNGEYNMDKVADLMNTEVSNQKIVEHWIEKAGNRKTVIFCSTIAHAETVTDNFISYGISAALITGEMNKDERRVVFEAMDKDKIQVVVNVAVLTEGWDYQPISCVVLLRPCSFKGTMIQMIGRGLRTVDPAIYPNIQKDDCVVLDFGTSLLTHESLEQDINLAKRKLKKGEPPCKTCPDCYHENHAAAKECEFCGFIFKSEEEEECENSIDEFKLAEINLLGNSIFEWADINKNIKIATTFYSTALVIKYNQKIINEELGLNCSANKYLALGFLQDEEKKKINDKEIQILANTTNYNQALAAASDFMNNHNTDDSCSKSKKWLKYEPSENQLAWIPKKFLNKNINRYQATCILRIQFNLSAIKRVTLTADVNFNL